MRILFCSTSCRSLGVAFVLALAVMLGVFGSRDGDESLFIAADRPAALAHVTVFPGIHAVDAQVITQANGVGHAVWVQPAHEHEPSVVHTSRQVNGVWGTPQPLPAPSAELADASTPRLAVHADGEATLVWLQAVRGVRRVFQSHTVEGIWRAPEPVRHAGLDADARDVQIVADGQGTAMAVWSESTVSDAVARSVWVSRSEGGSMGVPEKLNPGNEPVDAPRIHVTGTGGALVAWNRDEGRHRTLAASSYWNGAWTPSQLVDSDTSSDTWGELWGLLVARNF
jgi:hypothetical protein